MNTKSSFILFNRFFIQSISFEPVLRPLQGLEKSFSWMEFFELSGMIKFKKSRFLKRGGSLFSMLCRLDKGSARTFKFTSLAKNKLA